MDSSPYDGYFLDPSECVGRPCVDVVEALTPFSCHTSAGDAIFDTTPTTPQVITPQALLVKEEAAYLALLLVFSLLVAHH